ncbi:hypothetical protein XELAEV_18018403mg [Xenopus laevis]|uniref:Uncharacterized protein n=1 Tax=Xenopus laevis TaxID=8355 RepID=A0A974DD40_XENLA|nr:hypothetical protein XELAEV_18018403mg [Xenopus laevis]
MPWRHTDTQYGTFIMMLRQAATRFQQVINIGTLEPITLITFLSTELSHVDDRRTWGFMPLNLTFTVPWLGL